MTTATDGLLRAIAFLHPQYAPLINFIEAHKSTIEAAGPVISEAAKEGPGALAAAEKAAPGLTEAVRQLVQSSPIASGNPQVVAMHSENVARRIVGAPVLTEAQETEFLSQDSRSGSG